MHLMVYYSYFISCPWILSLLDFGLYMSKYVNFTILVFCVARWILIDLVDYEMKTCLFNDQVPGRTSCSEKVYTVSLKD